MSPIKHTVISGVLSLGFFALTKSWTGTLACFLSGIFIDIDHFFDFWIVKKRFKCGYDDLMTYGIREKAGIVFLIFHSYELLAALWFAIYLYDLNAVWLGIAWGTTVHLLADQMSNPLRPPGYFFFYRMKYGFAKEHLLKKEFYQQMV